MTPGRSALIVAVDSYADPQLAQLRAPARDAEELAAVLRDPAIGDFDVQVSMNRRHYEVRVALEDFFADRRPEDLLLLHFSCHGIKDEAGRLFFAASDTQKSRLNATAIAAEYVNDLLNSARSRRIVLLLDCCFSGAFTRGLLARGGGDLDLAERFQARGRAVLTASGALEYAWEGDALRRLGEPSIFTSAIVQGLRSGEADRDGDDQISVDELYDYVFDAVRAETPNQTPGKWSNVEGTLVVAHNPRPLPKPAVLPEELRQAIEDERSWVRAAAVERLALLARGPAPDQARAADEALRRLVNDDSRRVSSAAEQALGGSASVPARELDAAAERSSRPIASAPTRPASPANRPGWLPALVVAGGWVAGWLVSLALSTSAIADEGGIGVSAGLMILGWFVVAPLVAAALRAVVAETSVGRVGLIGLGWPVGMLVGLGLPFALRLSYEGAALLGLVVAAAGLFGALALLPPGRPIPWDRVLVADAGWCAGWLWSGVTAWPGAFWRVAHGYSDTMGDVMSSIPFASLLAGGVGSAIGGGVLMYLLLLRSARTSDV